MLLQQYGNGAHLVANFVGGEYMHRDHRGDPNGRDPLVPVKGDKQREALKFLQEHILPTGVPVLAALAAPSRAGSLDALGQRDGR